MQEEDQCNFFFLWLDGLIPLTIALNKKSIYKDRMLDIVE